MQWQPWHKGSYRARRMSIPPRGSRFEVNVFNAVIAHLQDSAREFNSLTDEPCQRLFYVGTDAYLEGRICGEMMGQALNGQGQVAAIIGSFSLTSHKLRHKGFESALREKYPGVQITETAENHNNAQKCYTLTLELLKRHPHWLAFMLLMAAVLCRSPSLSRQNW
jgi:ABC-type sugar transport system substrate-binding protein